MQFQKGDRVRILEIHPEDADPGVGVGDVVTARALEPVRRADGSWGPQGWWRVQHRRRTRTGSICIAKIEHAEDPATAAVDAALKADTRKATNPKDVVAVAHLKFSTLPLRVLAGPALALSEGAWKYGRHNYRPAGVRASVYFDAVCDHLFAWFEGEDIDPDSNLNHIDKALAGLMVLRDSMLEGNWTDDRPPSVKPGWIAEGHAQTGALFDRMREKYPEPKAPYVRKPK